MVQLAFLPSFDTLIATLERLLNKLTDADHKLLRMEFDQANLNPGFFVARP